MTTATIQIPDKKFELIKALLTELGVSVTVTDSKPIPYNTDFLKKIKLADDDVLHGRTKEIPRDELWK